LGEGLTGIIYVPGFISCLIVSGLVFSILLSCDFVLGGVARGYAQILLEGVGVIAWA
jgi:ABC-type polysaccharide transport system permease subunit